MLIFGLEVSFDGELGDIYLFLNKKFCYIFKVFLVLYLRAGACVRAYINDNNVLPLSNQHTKLVFFPNFLLIADR